MKISPTLLDILNEFQEKCSICNVITDQGEFLKGHPFYGPWSHWACDYCLEWLFEIERHNYDSDEGPK